MPRARQRVRLEDGLKLDLNKLMRDGLGQPGISPRTSVFSVMVRLMADPADGYGLLIVGYLVLLIGVMVKAQWENTEFIYPSTVTVLCHRMCSSGYSQQAHFGAKSGSAG